MFVDVCWLFEKHESKVDPSSAFGAHRSSTADMASASTHLEDATRPPRIVTTVAEEVSSVTALTIGQMDHL